MNCIFYQDIYRIFYLWLSNIKMCEEDLKGFCKRANTRMMEILICKERVEEWGISCLKVLNRFNNYPQTYKNLHILKWFLNFFTEEATENNSFKSLNNRKHLPPLSMTITKSSELKFRTVSNIFFFFFSFWSSSGPLSK